MTKFVEVPTQDLCGPALDWAVAQAEKVKVTVNSSFSHKVFIGDKKGFIRALYEPSRDWATGGPLIDAHKVAIVYHNGPDGTPMAATRERSPAFKSGDTILIAAMRAIVAANVGESMSVPRELV